MVAPQHVSSLGRLRVEGPRYRVRGLGPRDSGFMVEGPGYRLMVEGFGQMPPSSIWSGRTWLQELGTQVFKVSVEGIQPGVPWPS
jgi:hypothetical protein